MYTCTKDICLSSFVNKVHFSFLLESQDGDKCVKISAGSFHTLALTGKILRNLSMIAWHFFLQNFEIDMNKRKKWL